MAPKVKGPGEQEQVDALIKSVKQHRNFKQMCTYNLSCLCAMITPPNVGWMENIQYAIESGAIESIIDVLKQHPAALDVVRVSIEALRKLAIDAKNAEAMARAGAVPVALDAMLKSGVDDVAEAGGELIATIAAHAPDALLDNPGTIQALVGALNKGGNTKIMASVLNTLDRVSRTDRGLDEVRRAGGLQAVLAAIGKGKVCTEEMLRPAFRLLERFARDPEAVKEIRKNGGVQALVAQLEAHSSNEGLLRAGGRLLAIIAEDDLENTVQMLNESNLSPEAREFMTALISNLMLRPDNIDKVIKAGGIKALLRGFGQFTDATKEASARALGRMANNPDNIRQLIEAGAVEVLASAVANAGDNEGLLAAASKALANMVIDKETAKQIEERGAAAAVLKKLKEHPHLKEFAAEALALFENMAKAGHDMAGLVQLGLVKAIIDAMKASPLDAQVQLHGFGALEHMLRDIANNGKTGAKVSQELIACGGVPVLGQSLAAQGREPQVVCAGLKTLTEFLDCDPKAAQKACAAADTVSSVVTAVYPNNGSQVVDDLAKPLLLKLVTAKDAEAIVGNIKKHAMAVCSTKSEDSTDKLEHALQSATVFAKVKTLADALMKASAAPILLGAWKDIVAVGADVPRLNDIIDAFSSAVISLGKADPKHLKTLFDASAIKVIQEAVKQLPQDRAVGSSLKALKMFATPQDYKKYCVEQGAIESCTNAMRTFTTSPLVFEPALETLLQLSTTDELATAIVNKGAARGIIKGMTDNCKNPEFERPVELSLMVLEKAASAAPHHNTVPNLVKQGAINAVIQSMEAYPRNETIEAVGARVLARLLDRQGVSDAVDKMKDLVAKLIKSKDPSMLPELSRAMATVGYLALAPENIPVMREKEAAKTVIEALKTIDTLPQGTLDAAQARKAGFRTLGQMASTDPLPKELGAVPFVLSSLKSSKLTPYEKQAVLDCIKSMASSESTALELIKGGAIDEILALMRQHSHDEGLVAAALGALSALGEYEPGAKELAKGREQLLRWFRDNKDTAGPRAIEAAMIVLGNMALIDDNVPKMLEAGIIDMIVAALDFHCSDPHNPQPRVLNAAVALMGRLANSEAAIKQLNNKGALRRAIEIARSSPAYLGDPDAMEALIFLLETCGMVDDVRPDLVRAGATQMIMEAMNLNAGNEEVVVTGARALQTLLGSSPDTVKQILKDIADLAAKLKKSPNDRDLQDALDRALQNLANLILVDGLVDAKGAADIAHSLADLLGLLGGMPEGPAKSKLLARAVQALGRLPLIEGLAFDESEALKRLVETLRQNPDDRAVMEQCLLAMGNMLANPKALKPLAALGGLDDIARILATASDDAKLRDAALKVWQRAKEIVENDPLSVDPATMKAIFKTQQEQNPTDFANLFKRMAQAAGAPALLRAFGLEPGGDISADLLRALREHAQQQGAELRLEDPDHIKALLEALRGKKGPLTAAEKANMLERQKEALKLLGLMGKNGLLELARQGGVEALLKLMMDNIDDPEIAHQVLSLLNRMFGFDPDLLAKLLMQNGAIDKIKEVLKRHGDNPAIVKEAMKLLQALHKQLGLERMNPDEELLKIIAGLNDKYGDLGCKDLLDGLRSLFNNEDPSMISARLDKLLGMDLADNIVQRRGEDGKVYYYDKTTGETSWQKPQAFAAVISAMEGLAKLTEAHKEAISAVNPKALSAAVNQFETHANEPARLTALAKALATLASNNENRNAIAKAGGLQAIVMALNSDNLDMDFVDAAMQLLNQFSKNDGFRDDIAKLGGIKALIKIMLKFIDHQNIVEKCLSALANLGFNSEVNVKEIITHGGIPATLKVMQRWKDATTTLQLALVVLNNCMYGSRENKLRVGKEGGQEIINVMGRHYKDVRTFIAASKAMGNLSTEDPNIRLLVDAHAVKHLVQGMETHTDNVASQQIAIDVIGNFAMIENDALEDKILRGEAQSVFHIIVHEQGASRIIKTVKETSETQLLMSGMDALACLANDKFATERMLKMGIVPVVVDAMAAYDWDEELMESTVRLLATLTFNPEGVKEIVVRDGIQVLLSGIESHIEEPKFLQSAVVALRNIAQEVDFRAEIEKLQGVETVLAALDRHLNQRALVMEMLSFFTRMTQNKVASEAIAQKGMLTLLKAISGRATDAEFLTKAFILLGHLAFHDPNLKIITQYGGVNLIIDAICNHPESREMLTRAVQTLDNIAMANAEHAKIVTEAGGVDAIKAVMEAYADDGELVKVCKAALLSMTALETRAAKPRRDFLNKEQGGYTIGEDPLVEHRNLLKAGSLLTEWSNGGPHTRHVCISTDFTQLVWKDPKKTGKSHTMYLRDIRLIRDAAGDGHTKLKKKADPTKAFSVVGRAMTLDFEAPTHAEHKAWVAALGAVLHCVRKDPQWLK